MSNLCVTTGFAGLGSKQANLIRPDSLKHLNSIEKIEYLAQIDYAGGNGDKSAVEKSTKNEHYVVWQPRFTHLALGIVGTVVNVATSLNLINQNHLYSARHEFKEKCIRQAQMKVYGLKLEALEEDEYFPSTEAWSNLEFLLTELYFEGAVEIEPSTVFTADKGISIYFVNQNLERLGIIISGNEANKGYYFYDSNERMIGPVVLDYSDLDELIKISESL